MKSLDRRPAFWIAYTLLAIACAFVAWRVFPEAMPIVHLDVKMTREQAVEQARVLAAKYKLAPEDARTAVVFNEDGTTQSYVELEGGGKEAFAKLVAGKEYAPYWWEVRLFKLGVIDETTIRFRPDGARNGFDRRVPESYVRDEATKALSADAALLLAKERAQADWEVAFTPYRLLDQSQKTQPSGRVDHAFVFEREGALGEARIRLYLEVSGDELTEVEPYVHVPESFGRRYQEMRSANNAIAGVASVVAGIVYGLVGIVIGGLLLFRGHALEIRRSLIAGLVVGALTGAALLANAQAAWFAIPTTQSETNFWVRQVGSALLAFAGGGVALGVAFMAAEGLTRRAFPLHPQLWRAWSREAAPTTSILGRTAGGYLFVPVELAFIALFYALTNRYLGWWQPSEQLTDPNILGSAIPALTPISTALMAGMMEECVFRGIPIALGALIGARYGRRGLGIAIAVVVQAVVFGAAHANYPGFPSYSRMVELILPSIAWALIFLRYGLVPTMLLHALFDLVLMSIPIFLADSPGAFVQRGIVVAAGAVPMLVLLVARWRAGAWTTLPDTLLNGAWRRPSVVAAATVTEVRPSTMLVDRPAAMLQRAMPVLGLAGLAAWIAFTPVRADAPALAIDRAEAIAIAEAGLARRGVVLGPEWDRMSVPRNAIEEGSQRQWHAFVWREAGPQAYRALVGNALAPPLWDVRFARFAGDVAERAEEWRVTVTGDGKVRAIVHRLPEARKGASLSRADAQALADRAIREQFGLDPSTLVARGADEYARPARKDWVFAYADPKVDVGKSGEARLQVAIAGDEIAAASRSMYVPESWERAESERAAKRQVLRIVAGGAIALAAIASLVFAVVAWARGRSSRRGLLLMSAFMFAMTIAGSINNWPSQAFALSTTEPVTNQLLMSTLSLAAGAVLFALLMGLLAGVATHYARLQVPARLEGRLPSWASGACAAFVTAGVTAVLAASVVASMPLWPEQKHAAAWLPWLGSVIAGLAFVPATVVSLFLLSVFDRITVGWTRRVALVAAMLIVLGAAVGVLAGKEVLPSIAQGVIQGAVAFGFAWLLLRYDLRTVPAFVATGVILDALIDAMRDATAAGWLSCAITSVVVLLLAWRAIVLLSHRAPKAD
jgi:membrane protease YdiL (CAAX protease family)